MKNSELNKFSKTITQDESQAGSQAMLYGIGLSESDMNKAQVGIVASGYEGNTCGVKKIIDNPNNNDNTTFKAFTFCLSCHYFLFLDALTTEYIPNKRIIGQPHPNNNAAISSLLLLYDEAGGL